MGARRKHGSGNGWYMKARITWLVLLFGVMIFPCLFPVAPVAAGSLTFNGTAGYIKNEDESGSSRLNQNTTVNFHQTLTPVLDFDETVRYSSSYENDRDTESVAPTGNILLNNDLFYLDLSGTVQKFRNSDSANMENRNWQSRLRSNWAWDFIPALQLGYGESWVADDENPAVIDGKSSNSDLMADWDLKIAKVYYSINDSISDDYVADSTSTATNQYLRLSSDHALWDNRITVSFQGQYSSNKQDFTALLGEDGTVLVPVWISETRGLADFKKNEMPEWDELQPSLPPAEVEKRYDIGMQVDSQQVNVVYLYTDKDIALDAVLFRWNVFHSMDGENWTPQSPSPTPVYNRNLQRFELEIPEQHARYILLEESEVPTTENFTITRVEAFTRRSGAPGEKIKTESETSHYTADTSLGWRITDAWMTGYSLTLEDGETATGDDIDRTFHTSYLAWSPDQMFSSRMTVSEQISQLSLDEPEERDRSYALTCASQLLSTLDMDLGVTRTESYEDDTLVDTGYNYNAFFTALIFPDLTSTLDMVYFTRRDEETDDLSQDFSQTLRFTARLTPGLTTELAGIYTTSRGEKDSWSTASQLTVSWRASDILSMNFSGIQTWESDDDTPFLYTTSVTIAPTYKTQVSFGYSHQETSDNYNAFFSWTINRIFSCDLFATYVERDVVGRAADRDRNRYTVGGQINVRY